MSDDLYMTHPKAKSLGGFIMGLGVLAQRLEGGLDAKFKFGAEHDIIYVHVDLEDLPPESEEGQLLISLGFHAEDESWGYFT